MSMLRLLGLVLTFGLLGGLVRAADEPAEKKADDPQTNAAKSPSDKSAAKDDRFPLKPDDEYYELFRSFADTVDQVERNYVQEVDRHELMEAAIKGVLSKLDPYSSYIGREEFGGFKTAVESQFGGIGIQITIDNGQLKVASPLVGTPAYRAGIQAGDRITKIEGKPTKGIDIEAAVRQLKGEAGTSVTFTVRHALDNREETVTLKREVIHVDTVMGDRRKPNDEWEFLIDSDKRIGYIRLTAFSRDTASDLREAMDELTSGSLRGLVLDLRFNPGGLLNSAVDIADLFLADGTIVSTKGRAVPERKWEAKKDGTYEGFPMVVLVNPENPLNFPGWSQANSEEVGVRGRVDTGPIRHALSLNGTRVMLEGGQLFPVVTTISSNLYRPTFIAKPNVATLNPPKTNSIELSTLGIADVISVFDERIQFIVGGRLQRVQVGNYSPISGVATSYYDQSAFSPAVGFIAKPLSNLSVYGNFIQGLQQGPTAPLGTLNSGQVFAPQKTQQLEIGAKLDLGNFATTFSLFQIDRPFGITNPATAIFSVGGTQRNQGLEWMMFGEPFQGFRPLGGITLLNARQLDTGSNLTNGLKATGVPDVQLNLGAEWDASFLRGLTFSGRLIYTSQQYLDAANTQSIPSWTRFDAGVRYVFERKDGKPIALRFNVENLFNLNYWASANAELGLAMGAPRTFLLSLSADF